MYEIHYPGKHDQPYTHHNETGLIGKVMGRGRRWFVVLDAEYDEAANVTTAYLQAIKPPEVSAA